MKWLAARLVAAVVTGLVAMLAASSPAWAHGEGETTEGYLLVQQALGHLAHDSSMTGIDLAMEKVNDALETKDQEGVDVELLNEGKAALENGHADQARTLLQASIQGAIDDLPPATGNQTGTHTVTPELEGRSSLRPQDWVLLAGSALLLALGVWLAFVFRPHEPVRALRAHLAAPGAASSDRDRKTVK